MPNRSRALMKGESFRGRHSRDRPWVPGRRRRTSRSDRYRRGRWRHGRDSGVLAPWSSSPRGRSLRQICARITIVGWAGGHLREETHALAELLASILKKGLVLHDFPSLKESCLIWWMTVLRTEELMSRCPSTDEPS